VERPEQGREVDVFGCPAPRSGSRTHGSGSEAEDAGLGLADGIDLIAVA
jgi:hypothetical protein